MKRYVLVILAIWALLGVSAAQAMIIDDFMDTNGEICAYRLLDDPAQCTGVGGPSKIASNSNVDTGLSNVLGGTRDLQMTGTKLGTGFASIAVGAGVGAILDFNNPPKFGTNTTIVWDGDTTTNNIGASLGGGAGIDLTEGGTKNAIEFRILDLDLALTMQLIIRDATGHTATDTFTKNPCLVINMPNCVGPFPLPPDVPYFAFDHPFASLKAANPDIDLTHVTAIALRLFNPDAKAIDLQLAGIETVNTCSGSVGNFVWYDQNANGIQDASEPGINGVMLQLTGTDIYGTVVNRVSTTATNPMMVSQLGYYQFTGLCQGTYTVQVAMTPTGFMPTTTTAMGSTTANDSNGSPTSTTLPNDNSTDQTLDFGYTAVCDGTMGNYVWFDENNNGIQDVGEQGINMVTLKLTGTNVLNQPVMQLTTTIPNPVGGQPGYYQFMGLCAGNYTVTVMTPSGDTPSQAHAPTSTPVNDSDGIPVPNTDTVAASVTLPDHASNQDIDFGFVPICPNNCNDGNACTTDTCDLATGCQHTPVVCTASDQCHVAGVCDPTTGVCSNPNAMAGKVCGDQSSSVCDAPDSCDGNGVCQPNYKPTTTECRASAGVCDVPETCNADGTCPADAKQPTTTVCRAAADVCDVAEKCTGTSNDCPADTYAANTTICRAAAGVCDTEEKCTGTGASCPADAKQPTTTVCRAAADVCDVAEKCTGASNDCPADTYAANTTVCRAAAGVCDTEEKCTGTGASCPADAKQPTTTVCRAAAGVCDVEEKCTGASNDCPADTYAANTTVCRAAAGVCDTEEKCTGTGASCPADAKQPTTTVCRAAADVCDVAEKCTGASNDCPADTYAANTTVCRAAAGVCDTEEKCTGTGASCPADAKQPTTTVCRAAAGVCDVEEKCTGASNDCPADTYAANTTICRAAAGVCDTEEKCTGTGASCPADAKQPTTTVCRAAADVCDVAEKCTGASNDCPADTYAANTTICRAAAGVCDTEEKCTGTGASCPADAKQPTTTVCRAAADVCDVAEKCTGASNDCPADTYAANTTICRAAAGVCDTEEKCTGTGASCPADAKQPTTTVCRAAAGVCDVAEKCTGASNDCPADTYAANTTICRAAAGVCDTEEKCTGTGASCPADAKQPTTTVCRAAAGVCDVAEKCTGASNDCPADTYAANTTICRAAAGVCDTEEKCTGTGASCPADAKQPTTTVCRAAAGVCDVAEKCTGASNDCPADTYAANTTICRAAAGVCDTEEKCTGTGASCPADAKQPTTTVCRAAAGVCDVAEKCTGASNDCPADTYAANTTICRAAAGVCDTEEKCTGTGASCPADAFKPSTQVCRTAAGVCDVAESCTGSGANCPSDAKRPNTYVCRASLGVCDVAEKCDGTSNACPADTFTAQPITFEFTGNTASSGPAGNVELKTVNGVSVHVSAFSRKDSTGSWSTAYLGIYPSGLGVTDGSEDNGSNNRHKVDNIDGRDNYVLFEFSSPVVVNQALLDAIGADSDISVWIGTKTDPFNNHLTLSDALLTSLGIVEENLTSSTALSRLADINSGSVSGNVLVIAALATDTTAEDEFKIHQVLIDSCVPPPPPCATATFDLTGDTATSGSVGNIQLFAVNGVSVHASAFSRKDSGGAWDKAYLGVYPLGLGVTNAYDGTGSNNQHKVDNIGGMRDYVLFEFSTPVVVNQALLDAIGGDSDISVWIGTKTDPFNNHLTLSDALLTSLGTVEENVTSNTVTKRFADINAGSVSGNVLVISSLASDTSPEDEFKIHQLLIGCTPPPPLCTAPGTFDLSGNTATTGQMDIVRTLTVNNVSVNVSGFSRKTSTGLWEPAYVGRYSPGLGVTNSSEDGSNPSHKVDNIGDRRDYVLFEFSTPVVVDQAFLDAIGADSDISVWIGTKTDPFHNHLTLSDALLSNLGHMEENLTSSTGTSRTANINASSVSGNVVVIAALASDTSAEDEFKIHKLFFQCP